MPADLTFDGRERWATKPIDRCIALIVRDLNAVGAYTRTSCCGHGKGEGSIELHSGAQITIPKRPGASPFPPAADGPTLADCAHAFDPARAACDPPEAVVPLDPCLGYFPHLLQKQKPPKRREIVDVLRDRLERLELEVLRMRREIANLERKTP